MFCDAKSVQSTGFWGLHGLMWVYIGLYGFIWFLWVYMGLSGLYGIIWFIRVLWVYIGFVARSTQNKPNRELGESSAPFSLGGLISSKALQHTRRQSSATAQIRNAHPESIAPNRQP